MGRDGEGRFYSLNRDSPLTATDALPLLTLIDAFPETISESDAQANAASLILACLSTTGGLFDEDDVLFRSWFF